MRMAKSRAFLTGLVLTSVSAGACTGASVGADKAGGGAAGGTVMLRMASNAYSLVSNAVPAFYVQRVSDLSHGAIRIEVINQWGSYAPDAEAQAVRAVASGTVDLGWAGSRVFDTLGVPTFQALSAPMLIDSYPLEDAVLGSAIPGQLLAGLKSSGVTGLGLLGDGLRRPVGANRPLLAPAGWRGISFGTFQSDVQERSIRALGGRPAEILGPFRMHALATGEIQGFEMDVRRYESAGLPVQTRYITANVALWPQFDVLFANPSRLSSLTEQQRGWLEQAANDAAGKSVALGREDEATVKRVCALGARFVNASPAELAAMQRSLSVVYQAIEQDAQTKTFVRRIEELKNSTTPGPALAIPAGCAGDH